MNKFAWKLLEPTFPPNLIEALLSHRGVEKSDHEAFLNPDFNEHTFDPFIFTKMKDAVSTIFSAIENKEKITIHGDYDADGVSGSSLLYLAIEEIAEELGLELNLDVYLPDREKDGYGVAMHTVERLAEEGTSLLVTVDCGIANVAEFDRAHELGMKVVICDHHQLAETVPGHAIIIHPLAPGESYPNKHLCGTGVAYKLAAALFEEARQRGAGFAVGYEKWYLDFVAIATVTDVMPILGENRALERFGLTVLNKTRRQGIKQIVEFSRSEMGSIDTQAIGFQIGPRLNAAGRISSAEIAFKALTSKTEEEARGHAEELERLNRQRRAISDRAYKEALKMVHDQLRQADEGITEQPMAIIVSSDHWNPGIVGLVAGKLVTEFGLPAFALTKVGDHYVGSGRTAGGLHLVEAMNSAGDIYIKHGGHPQACGLSITPEKLTDFQEAIQKFAHTFFNGTAPMPELHVDADLPLSEISFDLLASLEKLRPFGEGNREPIFAAHGVLLESADAIGKDGKHLRLLAATEAGTIKGIGFNFGHLLDELEPDRPIDVVYRPSINEWNGRRELQFELIDLKHTL